MVIELLWKDKKLIHTGSSYMREDRGWDYCDDVLHYAMNLTQLVFSLQIIACLTAVRTYNLGATDFKNTEVFKEAIEYQVDGPEGSALSSFDDSNQEAPWVLWDFSITLLRCRMYLGSTLHVGSLISRGHLGMILCRLRCRIGSRGGIAH